MVEIWLEAVRAQPLIDRVALLCIAVMVAAVILNVVLIVYCAILSLLNRME
jgi:hypothetical protein